ncbi:hypothetical protein [Algoriphagus sp.]|uniref:hypothetical protein n=1 Tax=Algoriphagus sp. TaxID=1872435 RepID=UPI00391C1451
MKSTKKIVKTFLMQSIVIIWVHSTMGEKRYAKLNLSNQTQSVVKNAVKPILKLPFYNQKGKRFN